MFDTLIVLLTQDRTGFSLQIHVLIEDDGRNVVEHFVIYEDPSLTTLTPHLIETALASIILQGLNLLFFLAANQHLTSLPFYLWREEATTLLSIGAFFKEKVSSGHYVRFKMPTETADYDFFIESTQKIFMRLHDVLWHLRKDEEQVKLFLKTRKLLEKNQDKNSFLPLHEHKQNEGVGMIAFIEHHHLYLAILLSRRRFNSIREKIYRLKERGVFLSI